MVLWLRRDLRRLRLEKIGFIFQFHNLLPFLNSTENVVEAMELFGTPTRRARERTAALLDYLDVGHRRHAMPGQLSGGEAQRVAIARALANSPRIILADEPTAALDLQRAAVVMDLLRRVATDHAGGDPGRHARREDLRPLRSPDTARDGHVEAEEPMLSAGINQS